MAQFFLRPEWRLVMKSRITRATITVVSIGGLFLLGMLICNLNPGQVNAQRVDFAADDQASSQIPVVNSPPVGRNSFRTSNDLPPPTRLNSPTYGDSSAGLMPPIVVAIKGGPQLRGEPVDLGALHIKAIF